MTDLAKLRWTEAEVLLRRGCAAILPVGSTEAHGPHLPLDTDVTIALGMARRAAAALTHKGRACVVLPPLAYAVTDFAAPFAGTLSLPAATATALVRDVLLAAAARGFRPVALANAHLEPAHVATLRAAVEAAAASPASRGAPFVFPDVTRRRLAERLTEEFRSGACHAGQYEGSLVLADDPGSVDETVRRALPPVEISLVDAIAAGKSDFVQAGGRQAYFGRPAAASAEEGRASFETLAALLVEAIEAAG
ncbi:MAG TPA: creatininase family protein [Planctomycetota bacterium]|jgi:creatinine amidohydrolase|nr:creatininase family protein [Planctomycetota bacterium]